MLTTLKRILAIAAVVALLVPAGALAQSSSVEGYGGPNRVVDSGRLPFTGADLGVLGTAGGLMLALGFGLRRFTHRPSQL